MPVRSSLQKLMRSRSAPFLPLLIPIFAVFLHQGIPYLVGPKFLTQVNVPLIHIDFVYAGDEIVVVSQESFHRVQLYDSDLDFMSGFSVWDSASSFKFAVYRGRRIIDCTATMYAENLRDVYLLDGTFLGPTSDKAIISFCSGIIDNDLIAGANPSISMQENVLGYRIKAVPPNGGEIKYSSFSWISYLIAHLAYFPSVVLLCFCLAAIFNLHWHYKKKRNMK